MRRLKASEIECRVAQVTSSGCSLLLYKTARVDRAILDEEFGAMSWQNDFKVIDGKMYGGIGIYSNDLSEWLWRWDCGTESNTEAEKGQASDCFKRAGFKWGIGVELYTAPFIWYGCKTVKNVKGKYELVDKFIKFEVSEIGYSDIGEINKLKIIDNKGNIVFELGKKAEKPKAEPKTSDSDTNILTGIAECKTEEECNDYWKNNVSKLSGANARKQLAELKKQRIEAIKKEN